MKRVLSRQKIIVISIIAVLLMAVGYLVRPYVIVEKKTREAPSFRLSSSDGKRVSSKDFEDQTTVLHFWASWCAPCIPELPEIIGAATKLQKDGEGRPIRWILVSVDEDWEKARKILDPSKLPPSAVAVLDPDSKIAEAFGTFQYPETYVLTRNREVAAKWIGPQDWSGEWGTHALQGIEAISRNHSVPPAMAEEQLGSPGSTQAAPQTSPQVSSQASPAASPQ